MTMMMTNASYEEVVAALRWATVKMELEVASVDTFNGIVKLKRGYTWKAFSTLIQVNLFSIHKAQIVHVHAGHNFKGEVGVQDQMGYHQEQERQLLILMRNSIGVPRCKIVP